MVDEGDGIGVPTVASPRPGVWRVITIGSGAGKEGCGATDAVGTESGAALATRTGSAFADFANAALTAFLAMALACASRTCTVFTRTGFIGSDEPGMGASLEALTPLVRGAGSGFAAGSGARGAGVGIGPGAAEASSSGAGREDSLAAAGTSLLAVREPLRSVMAAP